MIYLVDYENTSYRGLYGISEIGKKDKIIIFYSGNIDAIKDILKPYKKIKYIKLEEPGENALDFMITTYIGHIISKDKAKSVAIISGDNGYLSIIPVVKDINKKAEIYFEDCIYNVIHSKNKKMKYMSKTHKILYIKDLLKSEGKISVNYISVVVSALVKYPDKNDFHQAVEKIFGKKSENEQYKIIAKEYFDRLYTED